MTDTTSPSEGVMATSAAESFRNLGPLGKIERSFLLLSAVLIGIMTLIVIFAIFMRSVLGQGMVWTDVFSGYLLAWSVAFALPELARRGGHVTVDVIVAKAKGRAHSALILVANLVSFVSCLLMAFYFTRMSIRYFATGALTLDTIPVPNGVLLIPFCLCFAVMTLRLGSRMLSRPSPT